MNGASLHLHETILGGMREGTQTRMLEGEAIINFFSKDAREKERLEESCDRGGDQLSTLSFERIQSILL